ncbi:MAG: diaminopimelate decarboxylase [Gammaproteobacteria bacterium]|nr:diaminopimelate decarboxylase [Gammaproteobacteria bacterium]
MENIHHLKDTQFNSVLKRYGTPSFIYDGHVIEQCYDTLNQSMGDSVDIYYSLKANPAVAIANILQKKGAGVEVCSGGEIELALAAGFSPDKMIFVGPAKKTHELARAIQLRIGAIVCESEEEFLLINELARTGSVVANVLLRVNPAFAVRNASLKMGGVPSQFGMDEEKVFEKRDFFMQRKNIRVLGIQVFCATRILEESILFENTNHILQLFERLSSHWQVNFSHLDIGGGFGVPYYAEEQSLRLSKLQHLMLPLLQKFKSKFPFVQLMAESGRYLVAESGIFISRIVSIRESRGIHFLITDGGMNCHLTAAGYGSVLKRNFPIRLLSEKSNTDKKHYHIAGPLCTPADLMGRNVLLPLAEIGDCILIAASGAYGPSASPVYFLGHGYPSEVLIHNGETTVIRARDTTQDLVRKYQVTPSAYLNSFSLPA